MTTLQETSGSGTSQPCHARSRPRLRSGPSSESPAAPPRRGRPARTRRMIRIMAPDLPSPSGGIKVIYNYVEHLVELGYDARVWHGTPGFSYAGWDSPSPVD